MIARMAAIDPGLALQAAHRPLAAARARRPRGELCIVGGAGTLGSAVVAEALSRGGYAGVQVAVTEPMLAAPRGLRGSLLPEGRLDDWLPQARTAVIVIDVARPREAGFYMPRLDELPLLSQRLHAAGVETVAVVLPHAPALLPAALREGLHNLDEAGMAEAGFSRLLFVRPAAATARGLGQAVAAWPQRVAGWLLSSLSLMVADRHRPVRVAQVAGFVFEALRQWDRADAELPAALGSRTRVAPAEVVWAAAQPGALQDVVADWLLGRMPEAGRGASPAKY